MILVGILAKSMHPEGLVVGLRILPDVRLSPASAPSGLDDLSDTAALFWRLLEALAFFKLEILRPASSTLDI